MSRINQKNFINFFLVLSLIFLVVVQVVIYNLDSTAGEKIVEVNSQISSLTEENIKLAQKIASASALSTLSQKANQIGLVKSHHFVSLVSPLPIASLEYASF